MNRVGHKARVRACGWPGSCTRTCACSATSPQPRGENFARTCAGQAEELRANIEAHAWDGGWYRRAYFDDGTPLGSATNEECRIDSISQSWAVLSGAGDPVRARPGHGSGRPTPRRPRGRPRQAARPALRHVGPRARVHQGVRARRPRERGPIHARCDLDRDGVRRIWATWNGHGSCSRCSIPSTTPATRRARSSTR